jgi:hypothetical protein
MDQRVIVGLEPDTDVESVKTALKEAGAESVGGPSLESPDILIVTISNDQDIDAFINMVQMVPGVRYAEPDAWKFTF